MNARMKRGRMAWGIALTLVVGDVLARPQKAEAVEPLGVSLFRCQPGGTGSLLPGNVGEGFGNSDTKRNFEAAIVFHHPVFAVTDAHGSFRIPNFPAAELVRITAWHPLFEESETFVWLQPREHGAVEMLLTPRKRFLQGATPAQPNAAATP